MNGAFHTGTYSNVFKELGKSEAEIESRLNEVFEEIFFGGEKIYFINESGDMGYVMDTGNNDVRTEGMSYAMMVFVQMNRKEDFDRIWKWARTYMYIKEGWNKGYFYWSMLPCGGKNSDGPAPDGEEFFAMALLFACARWGDGEGIFNYSHEARELLRECIHKGENHPDCIANPPGPQPMWNPGNKLIKFITGLEMTDPSYHLPHFYELFALKSYEEDRGFWKAAAAASREYLKTACHPVTGLAPEYSYYDGTPYAERNNPDKSEHPGHDTFFSDAYRVAMNIALDHEWFAPDEWNRETADRIQKFFMEAAIGSCTKDKVYKTDGTVIDFPALHPVGLLAANATASLAARGEQRLTFAERFWNTPPRKGQRRYYDNFLYIFAFLALGGNYKIYI
ncbi:MAG: glycosyl hydrolase family 8 [Oscillospiraceae bacterium]|nr:glycosyl hydrolase family 8 [Oscillospiraceae bacterium]